jgi:hypothetical protein
MGGREQITDRERITNIVSKQKTDDNKSRMIVVSLYLFCLLLLSSPLLAVSLIAAHPSLASSHDAMVEQLVGPKYRGGQRNVNCGLC